MATNICSRTRRNFVKPLELKEELKLGKTTIYDLLKKPEMEPAVERTGPKGIRVDKDMFYEILKKLYR